MALFLLMLLRQFVTDVWIFRLLLLRHCSDHRVLCQLAIQTLLQRLIDAKTAATSQQRGGQPNRSGGCGSHRAVHSRRCAGGK